ncbi:ribosomal protein L30 [Coniella lustricola]|uniref:Large ribosomal subunit protein uL30m n=1 Tax=Coniella lustricola TaxID=2025994 RepID=A0A2T2ZSP4_9PEZI|nr:ribosomal protein L30 [Coniella lustricola]
MATTKPAAAAATSAATSFFRIHLHRSQIGMPQRTRDVLAALGLHKRGKTVYHPVHPQFAGMIMKVKELVKVDEVAYRPTPREIRAARQPDPGFWVEKKQVR